MKLLNVLVEIRMPLEVPDGVDSYKGPYNHSPEMRQFVQDHVAAALQRVPMETGAFKASAGDQPDRHGTLSLCYWTEKVPLPGDLRL